MKNQTRINQLLTVLLLLCVSFVCMAGTAMAAEDCAHVFADGQCTACGVTGGYCGAEGDGTNLVWTLNDGTFAITGTGAMADYTSSTLPWAEYCDSVTNLVIEDGVTAIGNFSFYECKYLTSVEMPDSVTSIGKSAFSKCAGLTSLDLSDNVTFIGREAFYGCTGLTSLTIPASVTEMNNAFFGCSGLTDITISDGVTSIHGAFYHCTGLTSITIPNSVTSIRYAFYGCTGLESIVVPDSVTEMEYAFAGCTGLRSANIPSSVTSINGAFSGCTSLTSIVIPDSVTTIGMSAFASCTGLTSIVIPDSVTTIGDYAFMSCTGLKSVAIPNSVTNISFNAFDGCTQVSTVIISCTPNNAVDYCIDKNFRRAEWIYVHAYENGVCTDCGEPCPGHTGGEATCTEKAVCTICGASYGEVGGHTPDENGYTVSDGTHSYSCAVCGVTVTEPHTYDDEDGTCVCSAVKTYTITLDAKGAKIVEINREAKEILHGGTFTAPHDQDLTVKFANTLSTQEKGVYFNGYVIIDDNPVRCAYNEDTNTLTIPGSIVTSDIVIGAKAYLRVQFNLHGGTLTEDGEEEFNYYGSTWDAETATLKVYYGRSLGMKPEYFQLNGHTCAGAIVEGSDEVETVALSFTSEKPVDILWNCDGTTLTHVPAKDATCIEAGNIAHYTCTCDKLYAEDKTTVLTADEVKTDVDPSNHVGMDPATGMCVCGEFVAVAQVDDAYFTDFGTAITAWQVPEAVKLTLHANVETSARVVFTSDHGDTKVLDLNGCTWTNNAAQVLSNQNRSGMLTIQDSTNAGGAIVCGKSGTSVISNDGTLNITGGTIAATVDYTNVIDNGGTAYISGNAVLKSTCQQASCISNSTLASNPVLTITGDAKIEAGNVAIGLSGTVDLSGAKCAGWVVKQNNSGSSLRLPENYVLQMGDKLVTTLANGETGTIVEHKTHDYATPKFDNTHHWDECACGATTEKVEHTFTYTPVTGKEVHIVGCSGCTYTAPEEIPHEFTNGVCVCTAKAVAKVEFEGTTTYHATLKELEGPGCFGTLTLLADCSYDGDAILFKAQENVIDLNGHTLESRSFLMGEHGTLTITGSGTVKGGGITGVEDFEKLIIGANVNLEGTNGYELFFQDGMFDLTQATIPENGWGIWARNSGDDYGAYPTTFGFDDDCDVKLRDGYAAFNTEGNVVAEAAYDTIVTIKAHPKHDYVDGVCGCGATCDHNDIDANGKCPVCGLQHVASVTTGGETTYYKTLQEAMAAADKKTATVKLLTDVTYAYIIPFYSPSNVTLDMNGQTLTMEAPLGIDSGASLTITGKGTYNKGGNNLAAFTVHSGGTLTIANGTFKAIPNGGRLFDSSGTLNIQGGTFIADAGYSSIPLVLKDSSVVTVSGTPVFKGPADYTDMEGNTFYSTEFSMNGAAAKLDLSAVTGSMDGWRVRNNDSTNDVTVGQSLILPASGYALKVGDEFVTTLADGEIGTIVAHTHNYTTEDYDATHHWTACACGATTEKVNHTFTYTPVTGKEVHIVGCSGCTYTAPEEIPHEFTNGVCVCTAKAVAKVDDTLYANFANAVAAWTDGTTLTLLDDVEYGDIIKLTSGEEKTLDLNGHTLTSTTTANYALTHRVPLTINDSSSDGTGEFVADHVSGIGYLIESIGSEGSLTLNGGTFTTASALYTLGINKTTSMINSDKVKLYNGYYQIFVINLPESLVITGTGCDGWKIYSWVNDVPITIPTGFHLEDENGNQLAANDKLPAGITIIRANHTHSWSYTADDEKDTITATCSGTIGTCPSAEQSITLNAPDAVYSGNPVEAEVTPDGADLTYTLHYTGTDYASADAPVNAGDYTVTMTVGDKSVSASFTISPKDISVVQSVQFSLAQTSFVYSGEAPALNVTGVDSSVGNYTMQENTDYTVGTVQVNAGSHKLTVTGMGNYTGSVELDYSIAAKPITITDAVVENVTFDPAGYTLTVKEVVFDGVIEGETLVMGENGDYAAVAELTSENAASDAATANVTVSLMNANYSLSETTVEATFQITQSGTEMTATADKNSYTYGETITVTGTVKATGTAPATTLTLRSAPAAQQVALFAADGTQLTDPVNVVEGAYTLTYNTADKGILPAASITLTVKFVGDKDMADATANVSIALTEKQLTATEATATTRAYESDNTTVSVTAVAISGVIGTDDVKVDATNLTGEISSSDAGTYTSVKLADLTLIGKNKEFYTISDATVTTSVEITPKEITNPTIVLDASSFVYDGTEKKPAVTAVKDGDDLIDATEYTVSYANNIEMGTATVTLTDVAGGNYTVSGSTTFQITQSGTAMTATADKNSYTYGETITVSGTVKATGTAPAATLTLRSAPAAQQVALFAADGTQLTDPVNVEDGAYTLTYNTADKGILPAESITLTVKFVGDDNMADQSASVTVALTAKSIEPVLSGSASKAYDGTTTVTDAGNLTISLNGVITGDSVSATAAGYAYADETVGQSKTVTANGITLSGADSIFYTLAQTEASAQIGEIKKAMLIGLTEPADTTLDVYCADADAVIGKLPDTVVYHLADGKTVDLKVEWSCTAYDNTPGATNAFAWAVSDSEKLACYEIAQNVADDGTVIVTNSAFLPVTVTGTDTAITYNGTAYDVTQMFAIDSNAGAAVFEIIGGGTGEGTLNGSVLTITKAGTITIKATTAPNAAYAAGEATAVLTISKGTPAVTVPTDLTAWYGQKLSDIALPTVDGGAWSWADMNSTVGDAGVQKHQAIFTPADTNLWNITTHPVNITVAQAGTSFGEMKVYNGDTESTTFTYGETITVMAEATAVRPAAFSLRSLLAPAKHQMALFIRNADGSEVQISEAVSEQNGVYTMTYNTAGKALKIGDNAVIAKFVGDENMADYQETVHVTLNPKELGIASLTAQDRVYEPGNQQVAITGTEVSGKADANDDVSVLTDGMTATINSENVGTYDTALIPQDVSLTGNHAGYYFARGNVSVSIPQGVEITQSTPYTASGAPAQPVFDPIYQDGQTLGDIPVSLPAGTFNVPGTIEWEAPGDTPVTEGTPFTWVFTPDDPNWKPVTGSVVIYPDGEPPVITAPAGDQEVTVYEGEQGTMVITAADATSYQWYINRYDGLGYVPISGATSASYTTSVVNLDNDGFTYYCVASNAYGNAESPVFLLQVLEKIEVPETGDESNIALWTALAILSFAGLTIITMNGRRSKITR